MAVRGDYSTDLMNNMFRGYKASSDLRFVYFISRKKEGYKEDHIMTVNSLMILAKNKYDIMIKTEPGIN